MMKTWKQFPFLIINLLLPLTLIACPGAQADLTSITPQSASVTPLQSLPDTWTPGASPAAGSMEDANSVR